MAESPVAIKKAVSLLSNHQVQHLDLISLLTELCTPKWCATLAWEEVCELLIWTDLIWTFCLWSQISPEGYKRLFLCKMGGIWVNSLAALLSHAARFFTGLKCRWLIPKLWQTASNISPKSRDHSTRPSPYFAMRRKLSITRIDQVPLKQLSKCMKIDFKTAWRVCI